MVLSVELIVDGQPIAVTESGYLQDATQWNERVAEAQAQRLGLVLSAAHWEIILFIRKYYAKFRHLPNARVFVKAIQTTLVPEKGNNRYLHRLFPDGPLGMSCKIGGLPRPPGCL